MPTHPPVASLLDLDALDADAVRAGAEAADLGLPEPGESLPRAFHHGWRTEAIRAGLLPPDAAHVALIAAVHVALQSGCWEALQ